MRQLIFIVVSSSNTFHLHTIASYTGRTMAHVGKHLILMLRRFPGIALTLVG